MGFRSVVGTRGRCRAVHDQLLLLPISAREPRLLRTVADTYADFLDGRDAASSADICFTAGIDRPHHRFRAAVTGVDGTSLAEALRSSAIRRTDDGSLPGSAPPRVVFVFPGQGGQWAGMGAGLLEHPVFADRMRECAEAVEAELGWSPVDRLHDQRAMNAVDQVQPMLWAMQVALAAVWQDVGVRPDLIVGHSLGEIAAATVAGGLSVTDGAKLVCRRGRILRTRPGAMWSVGLGEHEAWQAIGEHTDRVAVGVLNSASSSVLSGEPEAIAEVIAPLRERGVFCRRVNVGYASHSPQVEAVRPELLRALADLDPRPCTVPMHSTVSNEIVRGRELTADYWMDNVRGVVRFADAVRRILSDRRPTVFVEVSPHPTLANPIGEAIENSGTRAWSVCSLRRREPETATLIHQIGAAFDAGCDPLWSRLYPDGRRVSLPRLDGGPDSGDQNSGPYARRP